VHSRFWVADGAVVWRWPGWHTVHALQVVSLVPAHGEDAQVDPVQVLQPRQRLELVLA
jgi:hypothetical protein